MSMIVTCFVCMRVARASAYWQPLCMQDQLHIQPQEQQQPPAASQLGGALHENVAVYKSVHDESAYASINALLKQLHDERLQRAAAASVLPAAS